MAKKVQLPVVGGIRKVILPGGNAAVGTTIAEIGSHTITLAQLKALLGLLDENNSGTIGTGPTASIKVGPGLSGGGPVLGVVEIDLTAPIGAHMLLGGEDGAEGPMGPPGFTGAIGPVGLRGAPGEDGLIGDDGAPGPPGATGSTGGQGAMGPPGLSGEDGQDGNDGPPGLQGQQGVTGGAGPQGAPGQDGIDGQDGNDGPPGLQGAQGTTGALGPLGPAVYMDAEPGQDGDIGPVGPQGLQGLTGAAGPLGAAVYMAADPGEDGERGPPGPQGVQGPQGAPGSGSASTGTVVWIPDDSDDAPMQFGLGPANTLSNVFNFWRGDQTWSSTLGGIPLTGTITWSISNLSTADGDTARLIVQSGSSNIALLMTTAAQSTAIVANGPTGLQAVFRTLGAVPIVFGTSNTFVGSVDGNGLWTLVANAAGTHTINSFSGASDTLALNTPSGRFTSLVLQNAGSTKAQFYWDSANSFSTWGVPSVGCKLTSLGVLTKIQPTPTAVNATATLTIAQLLTLIITSTTALAVTGTLPTGTLSDAGFNNGASNINDSFDWAVINTGALAFTVAAGVGHTLVGTGVVAAATSALFRSVKTGVNTFVTYRIAV